MQNVSKNMFKDSDESDSEIDSEDERLEGWKPPTASGVDNSKALSSYEDIATGKVRCVWRMLSVVENQCSHKSKVLVFPLCSQLFSHDNLNWMM